MAEWALGGLCGSLFMYNRENFMFDKKLALKREYQGQNMRIKQFLLYREDVRDLMNLTISKMDNYLLVNTLLVGMCVTLLSEGKPKEISTPHWLLFLYGTSTVGALLYLLMSAWLAMHASIAAHSFGVRMLTQYVRLPLPNKLQLDAARAMATDYEGAGFRDMLRVPVVNQQMRRLYGNLQNRTAGTQVPAGAETAAGEISIQVPADRGGGETSSLPKHIRLYRDLQANWQAFDAYARVSLALGASQLTHALSYDLLQMLIQKDGMHGPALACVFICGAIAWLLARLDLLLSWRQLVKVGVMLGMPPALTWVALTIGHGDQDDDHSMLGFFHDLLVMLVFLMHAIWTGFTIFIAKAEHFGSLSLPVNFRSVLYLDVFGHMDMARPGVEEHNVGDSTPMGGDAEGAPELNLLGRRDSLPCSTGQGRNVRRTRAPLFDLCRRFQAEIQRDLRFWEQSQLPTLVGGDSQEIKTLALLQKRFAAVVKKFATLPQETSSSSANPLPGPTDAAARVWLKLEWNPEGFATEFYHCCDNGDVMWVRPQEPDRVLELEELREAIEGLANDVEVLAELQQTADEEPPEQVPPASPGRSERSPSKTSLFTQASTGSRRSLFPGRTGNAAASAPTDPPGSPVRGRMPVSPSSRDGAQRREPPMPQAGAGAEASRQTAVGDSSESNEGPAQETRFGGREALQGTAFQEVFPVNTAAGGQTFHPQPPPDAQEDRDKGLHKLPGRLPWKTFLKGSTMLAVVWILGLLWWLGWWAFRIRIPVTAPEPPPPELSLLALEPHPFFNPTGLACHGASRSLLASELYAVHEAPVEIGTGGFRTGSNASSPVTNFRPALARCLAEEPEFHAGGIRGITMACPDGAEDGKGGKRRGCAVLLLGSSGREALRCDLVSSIQEESSRMTAARLTLHGGPWRTFVPSSGGKALWVQRERDGAVVMLQHSAGRDDTLVPQLEVPLSSDPAAAPRLHVLGDSGLLLGLSSEGLLQAWPLAGDIDNAVWSRRVAAGWRWSGLCAAGETVYVLGTPLEANALKAPAVWRLPLAPELLRSSVLAA